MGNGMAAEKASNEQRTKVLNILGDLEQDLDQGFIEDTFEVRGVLWKMRLLCDHERTWANGFILSPSMNALISSMRAPTLAIGIREIGKKVDGVPVLLSVEEFFLKEYEASGKSEEEQFRRIVQSQNPHVKQYFFAEQLFSWFSARPSAFVQELWAKWETLEARRTEVENTLGKSSGEAGTSTPPTPTP